MQKLKMHSPDLTAANIERLAALFPNCVTESRDDKGQLRKAVDFDLLRQELSGAVVEGLVERYTLNWPGKSEAIVAANSPVYKTLRPCEAESVDFDTTKNIYIEGDNLEVLKLLQETYLGKVKMIYIDPPYNTGKDFIYNDNFTADIESDLLKSAQKDDSGGRLVPNPESNGRFHSDWLSMMYPRLKLAKDLMREDGVIFISVDDHEVHNLRKVCDEIFGAQNFIAQISVLSNPRGRQSDTNFATVNDFLLVFGRNSCANCISGAPLTEEQKKEFSLIDPDNNKKYRLLGLRQRGASSKRSERPDMYFPIYVNADTLEISLVEKTGWQTVVPRKSDGSDGRWMWGADKCKKDIRLLVARKIERRNEFDIFVKDYLEREDSIRTRKYTTIWDDKKYNNQNGTQEVKALLGGDIMSFPKSNDLIKTICITGSSSDAIVLDFFSGSATTAHSVMQLNAEDGGIRRFIMVQLPEMCDEKSEAFKAGHKTICDIGKERIRRAGKKIKEENATNAPNLDVGFRVFKLDSSNMKDVYYTPDALDQKKLDLFADAIKEDRTAEDLLFQVFLDCGLDLALPVVKEKLDRKTVFTVDQNVLIACFDTDIPESLIRTLAKRKPLKAVFLDRSFAKDSTKLNVTQIFKQLAPGTEVKTL